MNQLLEKRTENDMIMTAVVSDVRPTNQLIDYFSCFLPIKRSRSMVATLYWFLVKKRKKNQSTVLSLSKKRQGLEGRGSRAKFPSRKIFNP